MQAVSKLLLQTIKELQELPSLSDFALAGGTNLALRFNHRISEDIDLFSTNIIGVKGFEQIETETKAFYGDKLMNIVYPIKENDQFVDIRFYIAKKNVTIKVDIIQNMKALYDFEIIKGVRCYDVKDIGLFKLVSCASRPAKKDIYDLEYITESENLFDLYNMLKSKNEKFNKATDRNIFDLDEDPDPIDNPHLLLLFDKRMVAKQKMRHSHDNILNIEGSKSWHMASIKWRMKVRRLYQYLGIEYPKL
ncbi:nucleotidyl transferase AbiEii/AbiGii toxin family protein [Flavivirga jejuensis]|uniref:Nucleotidyl transferase AbiEii/AbiGii toxin family protein n=1 Tax=Flavivirga jejuensis TaxID=870487 RepID=A0ABT8WV84_9FLAO|nr:nucleotidyl transferase AbiEii/AbiGii toxin family protein [Flavivirga jejuensis]MDO5976900.1 nucleotidyl transferase AbiEii/AbiGii toxin family protein [Flavivirga jejuensis]